jgi:hypothetical protein
MFLRFVIAELDDESHKELGVFHAAGKLRDSSSLSQAEETMLQEILDWFSINLEKPKRFTSAKPPYYRKRQDGISWFKDSAGKHIGKMHEMVAVLKHHDVPVRMIKTTRPGYVLYEDEFQVVAVPFADSDI